VNLEQLIAGEKGTHSDHHKEDTDGAKNCLGWGDTRDLLREIRGLDGHVQRGENTAPLLRSLRPDIHEPKAIARMRCDVEGANEDANPNGDGRSSCNCHAPQCKHGRLVKRIVLVTSEALCSGCYTPIVQNLWFPSPSFEAFRSMYGPLCLQPFLS